MKYFLKLSYRWLILSEDGLLKTPRDKWGERHHLSREYPSREAAIEDYAKYISEGNHCPYEMLLVEQHSKEVNWDE